MLLEILQVIFILIFAAGFFPKYYWHFRYQKLYDLQLQKVDFMGFLFSFASFTGLKLKFCMPFFFRHKQAEAQIQGMKELGSKVILFNWFYSVSFLAALINQFIIEGVNGTL